MITEEDGTDIKQLLGKVIDSSPAVGLRAESVLRQAKRGSARRRITVVTGVAIGVVGATTAGVVVASGAPNTSATTDTTTDTTAEMATSPSGQPESRKPDPKTEQRFAEAVRGAQREFLPPGAELRKFDFQSIGVYRGSPDAKFTMAHLGTGEIVDAAGVARLGVMVDGTKTDITCAAAEQAARVLGGEKRSCQDIKLTDGSPARLLEFGDEKGFAGLLVEAMRHDGTYVKVDLVNSMPSAGTGSRKVSRPELTIGKAGLAKIAELPGLRYE